LRVTELKKINKGKEGANYHYPNALILLLLLVAPYICIPTSILSTISGRLLSSNAVSIHTKTRKEVVPYFITICW
jgi:hypothetical protein